MGPDLMSGPDLAPQNTNRDERCSDLEGVISGALEAFSFKNFPTPPGDSFPPRRTVDCDRFQWGRLCLPMTRYPIGRGGSSSRAMPIFQVFPENDDSRRIRVKSPEANGEQPRERIASVKAVFINAIDSRHPVCDAGTAEARPPVPRPYSHEGPF